MNLQHAKNNPGKFHELRATATRFDVKDGQYGYYGLGAIKDELDNEEDVLFAVKKGDTLVDAATAMQLCIWAVRYDANDGNYKAYFKGTVAKQLQGTPQSPPQPAQATKPPQQDNDDYNDVGIRTHLVCAYISKMRPGEKPLIEDIEYWMAYIKTGKDASLPGNKSENPPKTDGSPPRTDQDGVPF